MKYEDKREVIVRKNESSINAFRPGSIEEVATGCRQAKCYCAIMNYIDYRNYMLQRCSSVGLGSRTQTPEKVNCLRLGLVASFFFLALSPITYIRSSSPIRATCPAHLMLRIVLDIY
jgi:hypothetical protein